MKRPPREYGAPTAASDRRRIVYLERQLARLPETVNANQRDLAIQLLRIGQLQADLDTIRDAWLRSKLSGKTPRKGR